MALHGSSNRPSVAMDEPRNWIRFKRLHLAVSLFDWKTHQKRDSSETSQEAAAHEKALQVLGDTTVADDNWDTELLGSGQVFLGPQEAVMSWRGRREPYLAFGAPVWIQCGSSVDPYSTVHQKAASKRAAFHLQFPVPRKTPESDLPTALG